MNSQACDQLLGLVDRLAELLEGAAPGIDAARLAGIQAACTQIGHTSSLQFSAAKLENRARRYLSSRKYETHPGGAQGLMQEMQGLVRGMRQDLMHMKRDVGGE